MRLPGTPVLSILLGSLLTRLPLLLVWLIGIFVAVTRWDRHPRASLLVTVGLAIQLVLGLLDVGFNALVPSLAEARIAVPLAVVYGAYSAVRSLISAAGWGLVLAAVFVDRSK